MGFESPSGKAVGTARIGFKTECLEKVSYQRGDGRRARASTVRGDWAPPTGGRGGRGEERAVRDAQGWR